MGLLLKLVHLSSTDQLIAWCGYAGLFFIVYAETGLMVGFFLPGDSLLVIAGAYAATHAQVLDVRLLIPALWIAAVAGDNTGYWFGNKVGPGLFKRPDSRIFKKQNLQRAQSFYEKHGPKTVVLARFVPIVRTFAPIVAGIANMPYNRYLPFSIGGGLVWIASMLMIGYFIGGRPGVKDHIDGVVLIIIALSLVPVVLHWLQERKVSEAQDSLNSVKHDGA